MEGGVSSQVSQAQGRNRPAGPALKVGLLAAEGRGEGAAEVESSRQSSAPGSEPERTPGMVRARGGLARNLPPRTQRKDLQEGEGERKKIGALCQENAAPISQILMEC